MIVSITNITFTVYGNKQKRNCLRHKLVQYILDYPNT